MDILLVADIFGRTQALETLARDISSDAEIFAPYDFSDLKFSNEKKAYDYFCEYIGLERYSQNLAAHLKRRKHPIKLIGFSVGSAAIWNLSNDKNLNMITQAIGFYGSQIRHTPNIHPLFPIELIFPAEEKHFCLQKLIATLRNRPNVITRQLTAQHGFMNALSEGYDQQVYEKMVCKLIQYHENN